MSAKGMRQFRDFLNHTSLLRCPYRRKINYIQILINNYKACHWPSALKLLSVFRAVGCLKCYTFTGSLCNWRVSSSKWFCCLANRSLIGQAKQPGLAPDNFCCCLKRKRKKRRQASQSQLIRVSQSKENSAHRRPSGADFGTHPGFRTKQSRPPHPSRGNQSDQSGVAPWGWGARPSPRLLASA